jgi:ABC transporter, permease protein
MLCKACGTEIPKKAKKCPGCGWQVRREERNIRPIAIAGAVISFIGGMFPFIQNSDYDKLTPAMKYDAALGYKVVDYYNSFGMMNYEHQWVWYLFMALLAASIILCAVKYEKISIITTVLAAVVFGVAYNNTCGWHGAPNMEMGLGLPIVIVGTIAGVAGVFLDVYKLKKKPEVDPHFLGNSKSIWRRMYIYRWFYVMLLPVLVFLVIFNYLPMLGLRYAFTEYKSGLQPYYSGIANFVNMFGLTELGKLKSQQFMTAFTNTLYLSIIKLILNTFMAVLISLLLNEMKNIHFKKTVQTIIYLPHFMSWVVVASLFKMILSESQVTVMDPVTGQAVVDAAGNAVISSTGVVNALLLKFGLVSKPVSFLTSLSNWRPVYFIINIWKDTGWGTILFLATLSGISPDLYEAAQIDGANRMNRMRYITLPALANTIITVFILNLAKVMNLFESVFVLYNDTVRPKADVLQTYTYRQTFGSGTPSYGYTTAVGLFRSVVSCVLVLICNYASKKVRGRGIV